MSYEILDKVNSVEDLKRLPEDELAPLCADIRAFLVDNISRSGGHLASNLGIAELTVAMHRVFDSPRDHIIFDVGHQSYVHKILTGRKDDFPTLRRPGGLSGFTLMSESEHDAFGAGHSSTSISAALGYAEGDKLSGNDAYTVCVIGDGAYTGGMVHEAINNCRPELKLIVILNENGMSISKNTGAFASYLSRARMSKGYVRWKRGTNSFLDKIPLIGKATRWVLSFTKNSIKRMIYTPSYFEELGFYCLGPIDGNNYKKVEKALKVAKDMNQCVFVRVKTKKGKGYEPAEQDPEIFHGVSSGAGDSSPFHSVFGEELVKIAEKDTKIVAITAAMGVGTGLTSFEEKYPDRYFDVGIAEEHALTFAAGLAANGFKPYAAIYSTFLQRGYDNIVHDIALQELPVRIMIDRAGIAASDGATHHGIFDVAFLSHIPGVEIISPATNGTLCAAVRYSCGDISSPVAIRYPNSAERRDVEERFYPAGDFEKIGVRCDFDPSHAPSNIFVTYGKQIDRVIDAKEILNSQGIECGIVLVERIKPYSDAVDFIGNLIADGMHIVYAEEGIKNGGAAMITRDVLYERGFLAGNVRFDIAAIDDNFVFPDEPCDIYDYAGLSAVKLAEYFIDKK